jgi:glycosyltransferase involved in cell wall biosynthesis
MLVSNPFCPDPRVYKEAVTLRQNGYEVTVLAWDRERELPPFELMDGLRVIRIGTRGSYGRKLASLVSFLLYYIAMVRVLRRENFEILHCHDLDTLPVGILMKIFRNFKIVFDAHEADYYWYIPDRIRRLTIKPLERFLSKRADRVIVTNHKQTAKFEEMKIRDVAIVANYPELSRFHQRTAVPAHNNWIIGWFGGIHVDNGIAELIETTLNLRRRGLPVRLLLVGKAIGQAQDVIKNGHLRLGNSLETMDSVSYFQIPELYQRVHLTVMLYKRTANSERQLAVKLIECMASGVPVIVADLGETPEIVRRTQCGIVLDSDDIEQIADSVERVIQDKGLYNAMSKNGRQAFETEYNWERVEPVLLSVYRSLMNS